MKQKDYWKNLTETMCVVGMAISSMNYNTTPILAPVNNNSNSNYKSYAYYKYTDSACVYTMNKQQANFFKRKGKNTIIKEAESLFGTMREATYEEQASVNRYINSISKETGIDFF